MHECLYFAFALLLCAISQAIIMGKIEDFIEKHKQKIMEKKLNEKV